MASSAKKKCRKYSTDYLKYGFISAPHDERCPLCLLCKVTLCNDSMKPSKLEDHIKRKHPEHVDKDISFFLRLKEKIGKRQTISSMFQSMNSVNEQGLECSYALSLLIAKTGKPHTIGEQLVKPAIETFSKIMLQSKAKEEISAVPLSNDTVRMRIDEMSSNVEEKLISQLKKNVFSVQLDETTVRGSESLLLCYVRFIDEGEFKEEMLFCNSLETTTTGKDIYNSFKSYLAQWDIPMSLIVACAIDGAPSMTGRHKGFLSFLKKDCPEIIAVHCVIHREHLVAKNLSEKLNNVMNTVIKCINKIKSNCKLERIFKKFCKNENQDYVSLLLHTQVRWLSKGNCLERFILLFDALEDFTRTEFEIEEFSVLLIDENKQLLCYLADIFEKLNKLNTDLQGTKKTLYDAKTKILGVIEKLKLLYKEVNQKDYKSFFYLHYHTNGNLPEHTMNIISLHLQSLVQNFEERFQDLCILEFPDWLIQPFLSELQSITDRDVLNELTDLKNDQSCKILFSRLSTSMWLNEEVQRLYPTTTNIAKKMLLPFPSSYLVECAFSAVADILTKKRNKLDVVKRGDLRLRLSSIAPDIKTICKRHQPQGSH